MTATGPADDTTSPPTIPPTIRPTGRTLDSLDALYARADDLAVTPGWVDRDVPIFWPEPRTAFTPAHWDYASVHEALAAAGTLIDVELAERRNLVLRNPYAGNGFATTRSLACAYQMILPGEVAPTHRHSPHAIRVMLDACGTYSVVDGERVPMETGDVILTPGGDWHGHGHDGDEPAYWFDALDIPLVHALEPMRYEEHPDRYQPITSTADSSPLRFRAEDIERRLDAARVPADGAHGPRITLEAPGVPSMGLTVERLSGGDSTAAHRSTAGRAFVVLSGDGVTEVDDTAFAWHQGDTVVVPAWSEFTHRAHTDVTLFAVSDEPTMRALGHYFEG